MKYFIVLCALQVVLSQSPPRVQTKYGWIQGQTISIRNTLVDEFVGVPFAKPPVGDLRFAKPVELNPWSGVHNATSVSPQCPQPNPYVVYAEDCLYLNIWRATPSGLTSSGRKVQKDRDHPQSPQAASSGNQVDSQTPKLKPVFHYIHGGGYLYGSAMEQIFNASAWPVLADVIIVAQNYRLGVFGFFHGNQTDAPGNIAIWDQAFALMWLKENIAFFGGDPDRITLFGQSAGSASVGIHITSPITRNLYQRAIMMSGSAFVNPTAESNIEKSKKLAGLMGCDVNTPKWVSCMKNKSGNEILRVSQQYSYFNFGPNIGDDLYPDPAPKALRDGKFNQNLNLMNGLCEEEGTYVLFIFCRGIPGFERSNPRNMTRQNAANCIRNCIWHPSVREGAVDYYLKNISDSDQRGLRLAASRAIGDLMFTCPTHFYAQVFAEKATSNNVYGYHNLYKSRYSYFCSGSDWAGVCHADELFMLFGDPVRRPWLYNSTDTLFAELLINDWTTYGITGKLPQQGNTFWPAYQHPPLHQNVTSFYIDPAGSPTSDRPIWPSYMELSPFLVGNLIYNPYTPCIEFWSKHLEFWFPDKDTRMKTRKFVSRNKVFKVRKYFYGIQ